MSGDYPLNTGTPPQPHGPRERRACMRAHREGEGGGRRRASLFANRSCVWKRTNSTRWGTPPFLISFRPRSSAVSDVVLTRQVAGSSQIGHLLPPSPSCWPPITNVSAPPPPLWCALSSPGTAALILPPAPALAGNHAGTRTRARGALLTRTPAAGSHNLNPATQQQLARTQAHDLGSKRPHLAFPALCSAAGQADSPIENGH
jgi:hypothetical protein